MDVSQRLFFKKSSTLPSRERRADTFLKQAIFRTSLASFFSHSSLKTPLPLHERGLICDEKTLKISEHGNCADTVHRFIFLKEKLSFEKMEKSRDLVAFGLSQPIYYGR